MSLRDSFLDAVNGTIVEEEYPRVFNPVRLETRRGTINASGEVSGLVTVDVNTVKDDAIKILHGSKAVNPQQEQPAFLPLFTPEEMKQLKDEVVSVLTPENPDDGIKRFSTGAIRSSDREGQRYDLISPIGMRRLAETYAEGGVKYGDFNWERGMPISEMLNHAIAHIYSYEAGDRSEDHLAHAAWNLFGAMHSEELWPELNTLMRGPGCKPPAAAFTAKDGQ